MATKENTSDSNVDVMDCIMHIAALAESCKLMIDADEDGSGGKASANAFTLACMISAEADRAAHLMDSIRLKGGAA